MSEKFEELMSERLHHSHFGLLNDRLLHTRAGSVAQNKVKVNEGLLFFFFHLLNFYSSAM